MTTGIGMEYQRALHKYLLKQSINYIEKQFFLEFVKKISKWGKKEAFLK